MRSGANGSWSVCWMMPCRRREHEKRESSGETLSGTWTITNDLSGCPPTAFFAIEWLAVPAQVHEPHPYRRDSRAALGGRIPPRRVDRNVYDPPRSQRSRAYLLHRWRCWNQRRHLSQPRGCWKLRPSLGRWLENPRSSDRLTESHELTSSQRRRREGPPSFPR
jgi:hypothetical protein